MRIVFTAICLLYVIPFCLFSQNTASESDEIMKLRSLLGLSLEELVSSRGLPDEMEALRGPSPGQDAVVFHYDDGLSLYWSDCHIWQVRVDQGFVNEGKLQMGMSLPEVVSLFGTADISKADHLIYVLPFGSFPASCALYFDDGLKDVYVFRSDF